MEIVGSNNQINIFRIFQRFLREGVFKHAGNVKSNVKEKDRKSFHNVFYDSIPKYTSNDSTVKV
jgi:hypothetical protein